MKRFLNCEPTGIFFYLWQWNRSAATDDLTRTTNENNPCLFKIALLKIKRKNFGKCSD